MVLGVNPRYLLLNPALNPERITFEQYMGDPAVMFRAQLDFQHWMRHHLVQDAALGLPEAWSVYVDLQNSYEALWWGGSLRFFSGEVPDVAPFLTDDTKWRLIESGAPDPFSGWMGTVWDYRDRLAELADGYEFHGRPVNVGGVPGAGTDGPLTVACSIRGATEVCLDMYADPDYYHALMDLLVDGTTARIKAFRKRLGQPEESDAWGFADDSVQLLSVRTYRDLVLPYHKRLTESFGPKGPNSIHLCGDATHLFPTIKAELSVNSFDTGFPVDHGKLRRELGPEVTIHGGPHVELLRSGGPERIGEEVRRICQSGVMEGGKFILREGNNLAPGTPPANVAAMYDACKEFGRYS
jgi:uroporphyrinogen-III decarboxylase